ncbi:hypothetical protein BJY01DRAFT_141124 [Aspergillus pseudoustus]|uniref:Uncharacterized protein n=1 Tax=Aspergillus pseudoustus TaxID=1810923 RepID=A0ABR4IH84_9EURO
MRSSDDVSDWFYSNSPEKTNGIPASQSSEAQRSCVATDDEVEIFDIEDLPTDIHGNSLGLQTVKPYAIEEPDDDTASEFQKPSLPHQGQARLWEDLVGSMQDLYCDSDTNNPVIVYPSRGRKRKPSTMACSLPKSSQSRFSTSGRDMQYEGPSFNSKRPRRRDKPPKQDHEHSKATQKQRMNAGEEGGGSSSEALSTDTSGTNLASGCTTADEMDID